jgi:hypothetical protein
MASLLAGQMGVQMVMRREVHLAVWMAVKLARCAVETMDCDWAAKRDVTKDTPTVVDLALSLVDSVVARSVPKMGTQMELLMAEYSASLEAVVKAR